VKILRNLLCCIALLLAAVRALTSAPQRAYVGFSRKELKHYATPSRVSHANWSPAPVGSKQSVTPTIAEPSTPVTVTNDATAPVPVAVSRLIHNIADVPPNSTAQLDFGMKAFVTPGFESSGNRLCVIASGDGGADVTWSAGGRVPPMGSNLSSP